MFNPSEHLIQLKGKDYLQVAWRIRWFREACPHGTITTEIIHLDMESGVCVTKAVVVDELGGMATGHGCEHRAQFFDFIQKSETQSIGRALSALGYSTQFCEDMDEGRIVDSPVVR